MKKKVSLESEINNIIANGIVTIEKRGDINSDFKESMVNGRKYEYYADFEDELRKRARTMFKKKPMKFKVPNVQHILLVFSNHRGKSDKIVNALKKGRRYLLMELGLSEKESYTLMSYRHDLSYALSIMPDSYK